MVERIYMCIDDGMTEELDTVAGSRYHYRVRNVLGERTDGDLEIGLISVPPSQWPRKTVRGSGRHRRHCALPGSVIDEINSTEAIMVPESLCTRKITKPVELFVTNSL
jgi:hypothetical protein